MTVYTLRPNSDVLSSNSNPVPAGSHWSRLNDNSDSSSVQFFGPTSARDMVGLTDLPALTLGEDQVVRVRVRVRYDTGVGVTNTYVALQSATTGQRVEPDFYTATVSPMATFTGPWKYSAPDGGEWT